MSELLDHLKKKGAEISNHDVSSLGKIVKDAAQGQERDKIKEIFNILLTRELRDAAKVNGETTEQRIKRLEELTRRNVDLLAAIGDQYAISGSGNFDDQRSRAEAELEIRLKAQQSIDQGKIGTIRGFVRSLTGKPAGYI